MLRGKYLTLATSEPFQLLTNIAVDGPGRVQLFPAISREEWRQGIVLPDLMQLTADQRAGRKGGLERQERRRQRKQAQEEREQR